jgi:NADH-quinone oxidoreductase subunit N
MGAGAKIAGYAAALRILVSTFPMLHAQWRPAVAVVAVATMALGSIVAVVQGNIKRMLAYSAIAHSGFLLVGVAANSPRGVSGSLVYLAAYSFTILGAFAIVYAVGGPGDERTTIEDYRGLAARRPGLAAAMALMLVSLAGIPPTVGFWAKFEVFGAGVDAGLTPLVVVGVLSSAIAAFFYLRVVGLMYLDSSDQWAGAPHERTAPGLGLAVAIASAAVLVLGLLPQPLIDLARHATFVAR